MFKGNLLYFSLFSFLLVPLFATMPQTLVLFPSLLPIRYLFMFLIYIYI